MSDQSNPSPMNVAVTGASGLLGQAVVARLQQAGHRVHRLVRRKTQHPSEIYWSPSERQIHAAALEGMEAVFHLAGEPIVGRWNREKKRRIRESRVAGTRLLAETLAARSAKPAVLISASAVGFYGDRGDETVDESAERGEGFLAEVAAAWEQAADPAREAGIRVVHPRFGIILSPEGGALKAMLPAFRMGIAGRLGNGRQWLSWVTRTDAAEAAMFALNEPELTGPVNVTAPEPVTNEQFTRTLGRVLGRPTPFPVPGLALRLAVGDLAEEGLLASQRVKPTRLQGSDFPFQHPQLEPALRAMLGKAAA